jgi:mRNA interferase MazF
MKPGDIVLVRFPQTDLKIGKFRPALVVAIGRGRYSDVLLAMITTRNYQYTPDFDIMIKTADADFAKSGLKDTSIIRLSRLVSVDPSIINALLGEISEERLKLAKYRLVEWLQT